MEPITTALAAFAAVQKAVSLIKEASQTAQDVASLGPLIGNYFDAKHQAVKAVKETKKAGGSNLGKAIEIELALKAQADFEEQLKGLFFPNNMDVWEKIVARRKQMDADDKAAKRRATDAAIQARKKRKENMELFIAMTLASVVLAILLWIGVEILLYCQEYKCGN